MNWHFLQWPSLSPVNEWFPLFHISMPVDYRIKWPVEKMDENDSIIFPSAHLNILCLSLSNIFQIQTNRGVYTNFSTFGQTLSFCLISRYYLKINDPITEEKRPFCLFLCQFLQRINFQFWDASFYIWKPCSFVFLSKVKLIQEQGNIMWKQKAWIDSIIGRLKIFVKFVHRIN